MGRVSRAVQQGDIAAARRLQERMPRCLLGIKFDPVAATELAPLRGVVREPTTKDITRPEILQLAFNLQGFLLHAALPETLEQEAGPSWLWSGS